MESTTNPIPNLPMNPPTDEAGATHRHILRLREKARDLAADAGRSGDPDERGRLQREARQLESDSEQESMMAAGDIYPTE
jgi:Family of unknown function (DUF6381)